MLARAAAVVVSAVVISGCGGGGKKPATIASSSATDARQERAADQARALIKQVYADLRRGDTDSLPTLMANDAVVIAPGGTVYSGRTAAVLALAKVFPRKKHKLRSRGLTVVSSPAARAAWAADTVEVDGTTYRVAVVLVDDGGLWTVSSLQLLGDPPASPFGESKPDLIAPGASELAKLFKDAVAEPPLFLDDLAESPVVRVLAGKRDDASGRKAIRKLWKKRLAATDMALSHLRTALTPDGSLGWIAAELTLTRDGDPPQPSRCFLIYSRFDDEWRLMATLGHLIHPR